MSNSSAKFESVPTFRSREQLFAALALVALVAAIYLPVVGFGFLEYDDHEYVTANPDIQDGLSWRAISGAFTNRYLASWHPLAVVSHALDVELFGMNPGGHHATNVVWHAVNTILLLVVLLRLTGLPYESIFAAALFAVHPQHVEPVAWISSRKDLMSAFFMMLTLLAYAGYVRTPNVRRYVMVCLGLTFGLLAKPMLVTVPCVLLLLDHWPLDRFRVVGWKRCVLEKLPLLGICAVFMGITQWVQSAGGAVKGLAAYPMGDRLANAVIAYARYLRLFFWPDDLSVFYPHAGATATGLAIAISIGVFGAACAVAVAQARKRPYVFTGWFWFAGMLVPVIGLVQFGYHGMADRYTYITHIGLTIAVVWPLRAVYESRPRLARMVAGVAFAVLAANTFAAARYVHVWKNDLTLFSHARSVIGPDRTVETNLGNAYQAHGYFDEAADSFRSAIERAPNESKLYNNLGVTETKRNGWYAAQDAFETALRQDLGDDSARRNLAAAQGAVATIERELAVLKLRVSEEESAERVLALGSALTRYGLATEAIKLYTGMPESVLAGEARLRALAQAQLRAGETEGAIITLRELHADGYATVADRMLLVRALHRAGAEVDARVELEALIATDSAYLPARQYRLDFGW